MAKSASGRSAPKPLRGTRRALSHVGGAVELEGGTPLERSALSAALGVDADDESVMPHVHGFHSYPARLHPLTASRLVVGLARERGTVLDPFAGSGTVVLEARLADRRALGIDVNPLAVELAWLKSRGFSEAERAQLHEAAREVSAAADDRRLARAGPTRRYGPEDRELYDVHVLLELDGLSAGIAQLSEPTSRRALGLVLSSILTKVSLRPGDTTDRRAPRRLAGGFTLRLFASKADELLRRLAEYARLLPEPPAPVRVEQGDARKLGAVDDRSIDLVVTSPPYPGVYDYVEHHRARLRWLGLARGRFERSEIGSRRELSALDYEGAVAVWRRDFGACLAALRRVLAPGGKVALVIADSAVAGRALRADRLIADLATRAGLEPAARASQLRPIFHAPSARAFASEPRREHVLLLRGPGRG